MPTGHAIVVKGVNQPTENKRVVGDDSPLPVSILDAFNNIISDSVGHSLVTTEIDHYLIHLGKSFIHSEKVEVVGSAFHDHLLVNTTDSEVHIKSFLYTSTQADAEVILYKGVTTSADGTPGVLLDKNFRTNNTCSAVLTTAPAVADLGTQVEHALVTGNKQTGGNVSSGDEEYVIKKNEKVLIRYTNNSASTDTVSMKLILLEVGVLP